MATERETHPLTAGLPVVGRASPEELIRRRLIVEDILELRRTVPPIRGLTVEELLDQEAEVDE